MRGRWHVCYGIGLSIVIDVEMLTPYPITHKRVELKICMCIVRNTDYTWGFLIVVTDIYFYSTLGNKEGRFTFGFRVYGEVHFLPHMFVHTYLYVPA